MLGSAFMMAGYPMLPTVKSNQEGASLVSITHHISIPVNFQNLLIIIDVNLQYIISLKNMFTTQGCRKTQHFCPISPLKNSFYRLNQVIFLGFTHESLIISSERDEKDSLAFSRWEN